MENYEFVVRGTVFAGSLDHAKHTVFWALENSEFSDQFVSKNVSVTERENNEHVEK